MLQQGCDVEMVTQLFSVQIPKVDICLITRCAFSTRSLISRNISSRNNNRCKKYLYNNKKVLLVFYRTFNNVAQTFYPFFRRTIQILNFLPGGGGGEGKSAGEARGIVNPTIYYPQISHAAQLYTLINPPLPPSRALPRVAFCALN